MEERIDLSPAKWLWFPSERTLANTFVLFRKEIKITKEVKSACGWLTADSRYRFFVDGRRVQWGPAPCDPRSLEADPFCITEALTPGVHVLGAEVLFYGQGDGTWAAGKPGFLFQLTLRYADGEEELIVSDETWLAFLDRAHRPGQYKRWYLRSLQENFDARKRPLGWDRPGFAMTGEWIPPMLLDCPADKPSLFSSYRDYLTDSGFPSGDALELVKRRIPPMREECVPALRLADSFLVRWLRDPDDWFEFRTPGSFSIEEKAIPGFSGMPDSWSFSPESLEEGAVLTFELKEQIVGWPYFSIDAPEGTVVELMTQEGHDPGVSRWMDNHLYCWTRLICRDGRNDFETFDFESLRWLQLHIRNASGPVTVWRPGVRRRTYPWEHEPQIFCSDPKLQRLFDAGINTLKNAAQETMVDGMGRERQQYSGDVGHALQAVRYAFGDSGFTARYLRTYSSGVTHEGYLMDCWPAYDRMVRTSQRIVGLSSWGPILDHSIQFVFDCWDYYMETGDAQALTVPMRSVEKFHGYLERILGEDGLLPVDGLGAPIVWLDNENEYKQQRHKQCAFTLYASAMLTHPLAELYRLFGRQEDAERARKMGEELLSAVVQRFWSREKKLFINNLPWLEEEGVVSLCDRSLSTALLFDQCPNGEIDAVLKVLVERPENLGYAFPPNAGWRFWALSKFGRADVVIREFRETWAELEAVQKNNTLPEHWVTRPDTIDEWSHVAVAPIYNLYMDIAGIRPEAPGFDRVSIRPQLGDIPELSLQAQTPHGPISFHAVQQNGGHAVDVTLPAGCQGTFCHPDGNRESLSLGHTRLWIARA